MKPNITITDCASGITETREMTDEEFSDYEALIASTPILPVAE